MAQKKKAELFRNILKPESQLYKIYIAQVDPDALASAFGLKFILENEGKEAIIIYAGEISHPQNLFINNKYNLKGKMYHISDDITTGKDYAQVLVDSSDSQDARLSSLKKLNPVIVIDHHRGNIDKDKEKFVLIDEEVGASATLTWELMKDLKIKLPEEDKMLGMLLALGIYTDTKYLMSAGERDRLAYNELLEYIDQNELNTLINYPFPLTYFKNLSYALKTMQTKNSRLVTGVGHIKPEQGDDISTVADELLRGSGIIMVVVWGIVDRQVRLSARAADLSVNLNDFLKSRFEHKGGAKMTPDGHSEGGALLSLDLGFWMTHMPEESHSKVSEIVQETIENVVFQD